MNKVTPPFRAAAVCDCGDHGFVGLTKGGVALIDIEAVDQIGISLWVSNKGYAVRTDYADGQKVTVRMHRAVLGAAEVDEVDHINCDRADNRRANLRTCNRFENSRNCGVRKGRRAKGVDYVPRDKKFRARISVDNRTISLGYYATEGEAIAAYDRAAETMHGDFARVNGGAA